MGENEFFCLTIWIPVTDAPRVLVILTSGAFLLFQLQRCPGKMYRSVSCVEDMQGNFHFLLCRRLAGENNSQIFLTAFC